MKTRKTVKLERILICSEDEAMSRINELVSHELNTHHWKHATIDIKKGQVSLDGGWLQIQNLHPSWIIKIELTPE